MTTAPYRIERLVLPDALDSPDAGNFLDAGELCDALPRHIWGNLGRATPPEARLQFWRDNEYRRIQLFFVRQDGRLAARSWVRCELQENLRSAMVHIDVLEEFSGRGIGQALLRPRKSWRPRRAAPSCRAARSILPALTRKTGTQRSSRPPERERFPQTRAVSALP
ncbi:hypothetical protein [Arthrobacter sp. TB 26]|uniref:hypothetical protein n=1 Tax=Arthrobacter sp. TB 26 TaxID=494420 RepID=UPI000685D7B5|nr:hypothetical protein [Arthrobacter sp. TB 26]